MRFGTFNVMVEVTVPIDDDDIADVDPKSLASDALLYWLSSVGEPGDFGDENPHWLEVSQLIPAQQVDANFGVNDEAVRKILSKWKLPSEENDDDEGDW